jgi:hypothetical protein
MVTSLEFLKRGAFKIAVLLVWIACSVSEAAAPDNVFDRRPDCAPGLYEHFSQAAVIFGWVPHNTSDIIGPPTMLIRHTATELQRRIAAQNAKTYYAHLGVGQKNELKKKNIRYLAVPTVRDPQRTWPKAKAVLMIWDIPRESLVGEYVYELDTVPTVGKVATYDKMQAEYIGKTL